MEKNYIKVYRNENDSTSETSINSSDYETVSSSYDSEDESYESDSSGYGDGQLDYDICGEILDGRYILLHKIGYGAYASVWLAYYMNDPKKKFYYAIKVQNPNDYEDGIEEIKILEKLKTCNCKYFLNMIEHFKFHPQDSDKPSICMVFELMACSLYQLIRRGVYKEGLPPNIVLNILKQITEGLYILHNMGYVHTDIKPENILIKGRELKIQKIIDKFDTFNVTKMYQDLKDLEKSKSTISLKKHKNIKKIKIIVKNKMISKIQDIMKNIITTVEQEIYGSDIDSDDSIKSIKQIDTCYIDNMEIVISDFGSVLLKKELIPDAEIQTRYYRAPEIILQCGCNEKCDIWSLGCLIYEILTGEILFDPNKDKYYSRDFYHLLAFFEKCGKIPLWMIQKSPLKYDYFNKKGTLKDTNYEYHSYLNNITKKINENHKLCTLLNHMLNIDYKSRINALELLQICN